MLPIRLLSVTAVGIIFINISDDDLHLRTNS